MEASSWIKAANTSKDAEKLSLSNRRRIKKWKSAHSSLEHRVDSVFEKATNPIWATTHKAQAINGTSSTYKLSEGKLEGKTGPKMKSNLRRIFMRWNSHLKFTKSTTEAPTSQLLSPRWSRRWLELWRSECKKNSISWTQDSSVR